ncbi:MAG: amino acid permease [Oscillospiraceae bacterium]|nr:amino acid permease [Oscillospiraceae bacterium]
METKRTVGLWQGLAIVVGMIIGSGIFLKPGIVLSDAGSPLYALGAWVLGGIVTLASALSVAEIAANLPRAGGLYTYLEELYGEKCGFLLGWVQSVISYPASVAAQAIAFSVYASWFLPMGKAEQTLLAIGVLALLLVLNILSTRMGGIIQVLATVGKLIPIAVILALGFTRASMPGAAGLQTGLLGSAGTAVLGTLWAYDGWIGVTNMAGEMQNPKKNLPRVICIGILFVIAVYAAFNLVIFRLLPQEVIAASQTPGADAAVALLGPNGAAFLTAGIMVSVFGALNGYLMTAARVPQAMASQGKLPFSKLLASLHPKFETPTAALVMQALLAVVYLLTGTFNTLTDLLVFVLWIFFTLGVLGVFRLRKRGLSSKDSYRVPLYPVVPLIGAAGGIFILVSTVLESPLRSLIGIGLTLVGLPVYAFLERRKRGSHD